MSVVTSHRLDGLEPDNLLAFLALLGLLRALEADDRNRPDADQARPRAAWSVDRPPLRPSLHVHGRLSEAEITDRAARGLRQLAAAHDFDGRKDLNHSRSECRALLEHKARQARYDSREAVDVLASLMSDAAIKDDKTEPVDPTPLCLLFGQGHQHFFDRLSAVPRQAAPPPRGKGKTAMQVSELDCLAEALFRPWHHDDPTFSFRWDPTEDVRYALLAGDPTDAAYKAGTQHGANRLAAVGLAVLTLAPEVRAGRVRPSIIGGQSGADGFSLAWPIWQEPAMLRTICAMMTHPKLREPGALSHLGVDHVRVARRISTGKFMNFVRARPAA
jgi:hypothetical protein